jgi:hypothetical protein
MMRSLLRLVGLALLIAGLGLLVRDLLGLTQGAGFRPEALGQLWYALDPGSLNLLQAVTQRYLAAALWDNGVVWLLLQPAFVVALVLGTFLVLTTRRRRRTYYRGLR